MTRAPQARRLKTRAQLLAVARDIVKVRGFSALRVEDVVAQAGTAKGTLFAHFGDKDGLMAVIVGDELTGMLDRLVDGPVPRDVADLCSMLSPMLAYAGTDRTVFDLMLRYSGATGVHSDTQIAAFFDGQIKVFSDWIANLQARGLVRTDQPPQVLAEGIQAFFNYVLSVWFCMQPLTAKTPAPALEPYIKAWLEPSQS